MRVSRAHCSAPGTSQGTVEIRVCPSFPDRYVGILAGTTGFAVPSKTEQIVWSAPAGLAIDVGTAPRIEKARVPVEIGATPDRYLRRQLDQRAQADILRRIVAKLETVLLDRGGERNDLRARHGGARHTTRAKEIDGGERRDRQQHREDDSDTDQPGASPRLDAYRLVKFRPLAFAGIVAGRRVRHGMIGPWPERETECAHIAGAGRARRTENAHAARSTLIPADARPAGGDDRC